MLAIDVVTDNPKIIYLGAASGGVWKSENGGSAWVPIFDEQPTQNIGSVAIQQDNPSIVWVGTGEGNPRNSMNLGMGIFKSEDGGRTWVHKGLEKTKTIHRILTHPKHENIIIAGATGDPFTPNEERGLFKSTDGGDTWRKILYTNDKSGVGDLVMDPNDPSKIVAAMYEHRRTTHSFTSGGPGSGLFVSKDFGENWTKLGVKNGLPEGQLGRIGIAIAPSDPNIIYAKIEATKNALYKSEDGGVNWKMINDNPKFTNNRPFYFQDLAVDSEDPNRLYNIYQPLSVSYDGGKSFDPTPMIPADETKGIHADFHAFWVNPNDPKHFIIGGDGGIGITYDHGKSWYFPENIPVAQFYHINVDEDLPYNVYGGMQDNGNWSGPAYTWKRGGIRTLYWQYLVGGDGFYISPDLDDSRRGYGTSQNGDLYRYDKLTGYYESIKPPKPSINDVMRYNWNAGFAKDPWDDNAVYYGSQYIHYSKDKGASWEVISLDLTTNNPEHQQKDYGGLTLDVSGAEVYNSILSIDPSPIDQNTIWAGSDDGQLSLTTDKGQSWSNLSKDITGMPSEAWIARIHASKYDKNAAWIVVNDYRKGDYDPYLFHTKDLGKTWIRQALPHEVKGYTLSFIQDSKVENLLFLGTEHGLWISIDYGNSWVQFKNGFPSVSTMDLKIQESESALVLGTFGRAIWVLDDLLSLREVAKNKIKREISAFPMNNAVQVKGLFIAPPGNIWSGFNTTFEGENKVFQKTKIPFFLSSNMDTSQYVTAEIYDNSGNKINEVRKKNNIKGLNYLTWKLDEKSSVLPGSWIHEESRGIPVLPGEYKIVVSLGSHFDSTIVKVIADPRFDIDSLVEKGLYDFQKETDVEVERLASLLGKLDQLKKTLTKIKTELEKNSVAEDSQFFKQLIEIEKDLKNARSKGQVPRPDRQVGAWQSFETSAYSLLSRALAIGKARTKILSVQERNNLVEARKLIDAFEHEIDDFEKGKWQKFKEIATKAGYDLK